MGLIHKRGFNARCSCEVSAIISTLQIRKQRHQELVRHFQNGAPELHQKCSEVAGLDSRAGTLSHNTLLGLSRARRTLTLAGRTYLSVCATGDDLELFGVVTNTLE